MNDYRIIIGQYEELPGYWMNLIFKDNDIMDAVDFPTLKKVKEHIRFWKYEHRGNIEREVTWYCDNE